MGLLRLCLMEVRGHRGDWEMVPTDSAQSLERPANGTIDPSRLVPPPNMSELSPGQTQKFPNNTAYIPA